MNTRPTHSRLSGAAALAAILFGASVGLLGGSLAAAAAIAPNGRGVIATGADGVDGVDDESESTDVETSVETSAPTTTAVTTTVAPTTVAPTTVAPTTVAPTTAPPTTAATTTVPTTLVTTTIVIGGPPQFVDDPHDRFTPVFGVRVTPGVALAGTTMTAVGRGFQPGELVTAMQYSTPVSIGWQRADDRGVVSFTWVLRADETLARHEVRLTGERSGSVSAWFEVTDELPNSGLNGAVLVAAALALLVGGVSLVAVSRRREH